MTMRDIQERTLEVARGLQGITAMLEERRRNFISFRPQVEGPSETAFRITAVPTRARIRLERPYERTDLIAVRSWKVPFADGRTEPLNGTCRWVPRLAPMLRGGRAATSGAKGVAEITVAENGMVELRSVLAKDSIYIG